MVVGAATLQEVLVRLYELVKDLEERSGTYKVKFWAPSLGDSLGQKNRRGRGGAGGDCNQYDQWSLTIDFVCIAGPNAR